MGKRVNYTFKVTGTETKINLKGRLTFADYGNFREMIDTCSEHSSKKYHIDLSNLEFIDSAGLGMLLIARDKINLKQGEIALVGAQGQVKKMLDLGRFNSLFEVI
jgi:HptB-dependent secretion and biofilm anti anti-sigma factor